jgi:hypothetical protein
MFPKAVLLAPPRSGRKISKKRSIADLVLRRINSWSSDRLLLWEDVKSCAGVRAGKESEVSVKLDGAELHKRSIEKAAVAALRFGDVRKSLRILIAAPLAPKSEGTFTELKKLHPFGKNPHPQPLFETPAFSQELVKTALASFSTGSSAGLFGYRPFQECSCGVFLVFACTYCCC